MNNECIYKLIDEGTSLLKIVNTNLNESIAKFKVWQISVDTQLTKLGLLKSTLDNIKLSMHYKPNVFSEQESKKILIDTIQNTIILLNEVYQDTIESTEISDLTETVALTVIRKILSNFHLHLKEMYQEKVHGNGTLLQEDLSKITIGNEYDIQRILYSLLRPIFPTARLEVNDDTGYSGIRYDIMLKNYDLIIEVKCSRPSMKERDLSEELGADGFNYNGKYLFMFIYDKDIIIKNTDAFKLAFKRDLRDFDKNIEVFILQPIKL